MTKTALDLTFERLPHTAAEHFRLLVHAAVLRVLRQVALGLGQDGGSLQDTILEHFPFLGGYVDELAAFGLDGMSLAEAEETWRLALSGWERASSGPLPLVALREASGLDDEAIVLLVAAGLIEEDARFGPLFAALHGAPGQHWPTQALLTAWWNLGSRHGEARPVLRRLQSLGLLAVVNPERPRLEQAFEAPALVWDALRGERHAGLAAWCGYRPPSDLAALDELVLPAEPRALLAALPGLVQGGEVQTLVVRGPSHNGRRTALGAAARQLGRGLLVVDGAALDDERWRLIGPLATLLEAVPVLALALDPGQSAALPALDGYDGLLGVVMGQVGGLRGPRAERALTMTLEMPAAEARRELWQRSLQMPAAPGHLEATAERMRLTSGHIQRAASLACTYAALGSRPAVTLADVRQGSRALNRQALETLAQQVETGGDWSRLAVGAETRRELLSLESRCRHRERLHASVNPLLAAQMNCGVRALFSGPSGTGKTLAARLLASVLEMDLYRLDLAAVVNKYIGETEKNLSQVFARAEELDVILLLDEGDALLTQRTAVNTSNDRYANLETNYLLQRIESYQGILLITTNAGDRIDSAFQRRMDVVVDFRLPEIDERRAIWQSHLPADLAVDRALLDEIVHRCALSGGQIRNAVLHASLLALGNGGVMAGEHLEAALQREYRKTGGVCPLRPVHSNGNGRGR